jgi:5,10-methylene-tetrahydrofolate dehydrogenase/methenyl tetrahydrofolate cyclohydrolase
LFLLDRILDLDARGSLSLLSFAGSRLIRDSGNGHMCRMQMNLAGRKVVVFGAARGIGRAIAEAFVAEDCDVCGVDLETDVPPLTDGSSIAGCDVTA